jgi:hypothetical protein
MTLSPNSATNHAQVPDAELDGEIWGVATCFNPAGYANRYGHLRRFASCVRAQGLKLLLVEAAFGDQPFILDDADADYVLRARAASILWQKERLLNIALDALPPSCDKVVWLDSDLLFENPHWVAQTSALLRSYPAVQCFERACFLEQDQPDPPREELLRAALAWEDGAACLWCRTRQRSAGGHTGFAWAARRSLLARHSFFDRAILGGADAIMFWGMTGVQEEDPERSFLRNVCSPGLYRDIVAWCDAFHLDVQGRIAHTPGRVFHLWHGSKRDRRYGSRNFILRRAGFDPAIDIAIDSQQCWAWSSDKPDLHRNVRAYFHARKEDGSRLEVAATV